jgi:ribosomal protein S12 methylthiotransferase
MKKVDLSFVSLWCVKNLVDTQYLIWKIFSYDPKNLKYKINFYTNPYDSDVDIIFVNTCGFLSSARQEMLDTILDLLKNTKAKIYILWCWLKYYNWNLPLEDDLQQLSGWRVFYLSWEDLDIVSLDKLLSWYNSIKFSDYKFPNSPRAYTNAIYWFEYLKIAEWCNNSCSFCIIPKIRWKQKSLPIEKIIEEVKNMVYNWIREIILIAQDITRYWIDIYWRPYLFNLLEELEKLDLDFRYRILYLYPDIVSLKQLEKLKWFEKFIPYFDIPLQHISRKILKSMKRFYNTDFIYNFLDFINENWKEKFVRTNFIVWFPGETDKDFKELLDFVKKWYFDNIAIFWYHDEPLAESYKMSNKVPDDVIQERFKILSDVVNDLIDKKMEEKYKWKKTVWTVMNILENELIIKPYLHAPEIDPYHKVSFDKILWVISDNWQIDIGMEVVYMV